LGKSNPPPIFQGCPLVFHWGGLFVIMQWPLSTEVCLRAKTSFSLVPLPSGATVPFPIKKGFFFFSSLHLFSRGTQGAFVATGHMFFGTPVLSPFGAAKHPPAGALCRASPPPCPASFFFPAEQFFPLSQGPRHSEFLLLYKFTFPNFPSPPNPLRMPWSLPTPFPPKDNGCQNPPLAARLVASIFFLFRPRAFRGHLYSWHSLFGFLAPPVFLSSK